MVPTKEMNPYVPITPEEIVKDAMACKKLGCSIVHIHPRDKDGKPTWKKEYFKKIIGMIREKAPELLISATTSGRHWPEFEKRSECLELSGDYKPDMASLTVGSMNFMHDPSTNSPQIIEQLALKMKEKGIKPELEIFEAGMIHKAKFLMEKNILSSEKPYFNIFFGNLGTAPLDAVSVGSFLGILPLGSIYSFGGIGRFQLDSNMAGVAFDGNIRVGLEDNIFMDAEKKHPASNAMLVERIVKIIKLSGREIATPKETRKMLNIK